MAIVMLLLPTDAGHISFNWHNTN